MTQINTIADQALDLNKFKADVTVMPKNAINNQYFDHSNPEADASFLSDEDPVYNEQFERQDAGGMVTQDNGIADILLKNDHLYNAMKGDWKRTDFNKSHNIKITTGREDGKFYIQREQFNVRAVARRCAEYRKGAEDGMLDPLAPLMPDGKIGYKWMELPDVCSIAISDKYFGGMPWNVIKRDRTLKAQFYRVVETEYNAFVCYPGGKLPIPIDVPYPTEVGQTKFFRGM
jgi:hypothetical protein